MAWRLRHIHGDVVGVLPIEAVVDNLREPGKRPQMRGGVKRLDRAVPGLPLIRAVLGIPSGEITLRFDRVQQRRRGRRSEKFNIDFGGSVAVIEQGRYRSRNTCSLNAG